MSGNNDKSGISGNSGKRKDPPSGRPGNDPPSGISSGTQEKKRKEEPMVHTPLLGMGSGSFSEAIHAGPSILFNSSTRQVRQSTSSSSTSNAAKMNPSAAVTSSGFMNAVNTDDTSIRPISALIEEIANAHATETANESTRTNENPAKIVPRASSPGSSSNSDNSISSLLSLLRPSQNRSDSLRSRPTSSSVTMKTEANSSPGLSGTNPAAKIASGARGSGPTSIKGGPCAVKPPDVVSNAASPNAPYTRLTVPQLKELLKNTKRMSYLLVDCRVSSSFCKSRIQFSVNVSLDENQTSLTQRFASRVDVMTFLLVNCQTLVESLNGPGFYNEIVVLDELSTSTQLYAPTKTLLDALTKYNEGTKTKTCLLEGGFQLFAKLLPYRLVSDPTGPPESILLLPTNTNETQNAFLDMLKGYYDNLRIAINTVKRMITTRRQQKSLEGVQLALITDIENEMAKKVEKVIPEEARCPICFDVFSGEIIQCGNGHSVCSNCSKSLSVCPECRISYMVSNGGIRNRSLEKMLNTAFKTECIYSSKGCEEKLTYGKLSAHAEICGFKMREELHCIEKEMKAAKKALKKTNDELDTVTKAIETAESLWNVSEDKILPEIPGKDLAKIQSRLYSLNKAKFLLISEVFSVKGSFPEKSSLFY